MTPSKCFLLLLTILASTFCTTADAASLQYENQPIERLEVDIANMPVDGPSGGSIVKSRIKTKEGGLFCQSEFDNDLKILAQEFDRIDPVLECIDGKIYITLKIWPRPIIRSITWKGNHKLKTKTLLSELDIPTPSVYDRVAFNKAFAKVKTLYVKDGFFEAELEYFENLAPDCNEIDIEIVIREGRAGKIRRVVFCNFTQDETNELADMIMTKPYFFLTSWFNGEGIYHEEAIHQDEFFVLNYIQNRGFADARVSVEIREVGCDRIDVAFKVDRGDQYRFGKLTINGNKIYCTETLTPILGIEEGDIYSPDDLRGAINNLTEYYGRFGYIEANVDYEPRHSCEALAYDVDFTIDEGEQFRVGLIKVLGNCVTQTSVILNETLLTPGEVFNTLKLEVTEERLANVGYFSNVNVYAVKSDGADGLGGNYRDVHIEVQEQNTGQFGASFGFSTVESLFGTINVTEKNFNSAGITEVGKKGISALRGGGEYTSISCTVGTKSLSYVYAWTKPYFMDTDWTVGYEIEKADNRYISDDYNIKTIGYTVRAAHQLNPFVKFMTHYRIKNTHIDLNVDSYVDDILKDVAEKDKPAARKQIVGLAKIEEEVANSGLISAVGVSWIYDSTNRPVRPTSGFKSRFEIEFVGVGGYHTFINFSYLNNYFFKLNCIDEVGVWKFRCDMRFIEPIHPANAGSIPLDERYFLGGSYTIRGYRPFKPGPKYTDGDPRGGISIQYLSLEYARQLWSRVEAFAFIDSGHLSMRRYNIGRMETSIGVGFRLNVLPGQAPLTLGMGWPVDPQIRGDIKKFFIDLGGQF